MRMSAMALNVSNTENSALKAKISHLEKQINDLANSRAILGCQADKRQVCIDELRSTNTTLGTKVGELENELQQEREVSAKSLENKAQSETSLKDQIRGLRKSVSQLHQANIASNQNNNKLNVRLQQLENNNTVLNSNVEQLQTANNNLSSTIEEQKVKISSQETLLENAMAKVNELQGLRDENTSLKT